MLFWRSVVGAWRWATKSYKKIWMFGSGCHKRGVWACVCDRQLALGSFDEGGARQMQRTAEASKRILVYCAVVCALCRKILRGLRERQGISGAATLCRPLQKYICFAWVHWAVDAYDEQCLSPGVCDRCIVTPPAFKKCPCWRFENFGDGGVLRCAYGARL